MVTSKEMKKPECTGDMNAHGIRLVSRYGKIQEMIEMLNAAQDLRQRDLTFAVKELFYDGKSNCLSYTLSDNQMYRAVDLVMSRHITQFESLNGCVYHQEDFEMPI
jgi:hypothetical protein